MRVSGILRGSARRARRVPARPVSKQPGARVIEGTINRDGSLRVRVTATGDETALAGIMQLVGRAQMSKSNTQILADRAAGWLFYIALAVALVTAVAWVIAVGFQLEVLARVVTVLVIACPHWMHGHCPWDTSP